MNTIQGWIPPKLKSKLSQQSLFFKMRFSHISSAFAASAITLSTVDGLDILVTNDDGSGVSNIREIYKPIKTFGHSA
ncbi:hypothetical protein F5882DRAFT_403395 [Hyaloscypha sp. PMI_1271]|nr:hypothetical protein F5882DRAFT_403395 [Hyaloscypha sp. PMI_1271]